MECGCWDGVVKVDGCCYFHAKLGAGLIRRDFQEPNGSRLTPRQELFVGLEDPDVSGRWDFTEVPDVLSQLLAREVVTGLDRTVPENWDRPLKGATMTDDEGSEVVKYTPRVDEADQIEAGLRDVLAALGLKSVGIFPVAPEDVEAGGVHLLNVLGKAALRAQRDEHVLMLLTFEAGGMVVSPVFVEVERAG